MVGFILPMAIALTAAMNSEAATENHRTRPVHSAPASAPSAAPLLAPGLDMIRLAMDAPGRHVDVWIHRPAGYAPSQRPPLIVCLHGTDDTAQEMIGFWQTRRMRIPAVLVAPQGIGKGWSSDDEPALTRMFERLPDLVWHDSRRVLLTGFSAGGAMTFQMIYKQNVPVTAAACLANYVPPRLSRDEVHARRHLPVFYAVGAADINHELMRTGLHFLRSAGANVELYNPVIGHKLDPEVAQAALDWFFDWCTKQVNQEIEAASKSQEAGPALERLEQIVSQSNWHEADHVASARRAVVDLEQAGQDTLKSADRLVHEGQLVEAVQLLRAMENRYGISRIATVARTRREALEADNPELPQMESSHRAELALAEYLRAQKLVAQQRLAEAADVCRRIESLYAETPAADRARNLLKLLERR